MLDLPPTPGQTVGPFFHYGLCFPGDSYLAPPGHRNSIRLHGNVFDGTGAPVPDALIEVWQANDAGAIISKYGSLVRDGWSFTGWGRATTDASGHYDLSTVPPGNIGLDRTAFFAISIVARGLLDTLFTRAYLPHGNLADDALLRRLDEARRNTLVCRYEPDGCRFDIRLQGVGETVFLTYARAPHG